MEGLRDELETTKDNLEYVQDRIKSGQNDIMALMETKAVSSEIRKSKYKYLVLLLLGIVMISQVFLHVS